MAVLPRIIARIRNSEEFAKVFPLLSTEQNKSETGESSKKRKRCHPEESRDLVIYTEAIPLRQMAVAPESEGHKRHADKFPLCATCGLHHAKDRLCKHCLNCGEKGHWSRDCNNPPTHNQNPGNTTYPLPRYRKDCYVCGLSEHISRDCPVRISSTSPVHSTGKDPLCSVCHHHHRAELSCVSCTFCGKYEHWIQKCRLNLTREQKQKASTSTSSQHNNNCYTCGMHGHFARDCSRKMHPADPAVTEELLALPAPGEHSESDDSIGMQISS
ncbi:hypothetical protein E3N88_29000 [Mikania micrantha]|uniref:CCHC-type domain-containing protein n=1 Tax=Mikania micrantha TaxID=192012 RepID=A0A5N6N147_9ASTR|nr:hypothetical protein E3N88_29000 [Mikania micrantha]